MKRYPHYWWPLKGQTCPRQIAVLDCDGTPTTGMPGQSVRNEQLTGWCLSWVTLKAGTPQREATACGDDRGSLLLRLSQLLSSKDRTWLFASPCGRILPMIGFWNDLESGAWRLAGKDWHRGDDKPMTGDSSGDGVCIVEDPPTVIVCRLRGRPGKLTLLDIRNWGIDLLDRELTAHERTRQYLSGICDCLSALRSWGRVSLRCTSGSQAVSALRSLDGCVRLHCHCYVQALAIERAAYYGGRCEAFRLGKLTGPVYHVDVRSMYPSLCLDLPVPVSLRRYHHDPGSAEAACRDRPECCAASVRVRTAVPAYPLRRNGDVLYPIGVFDTYLCGAELRAAVESDHVTRWHDAAEYTCAPVLRPYFSKWLALLSIERAQGRVHSCQYIKRVMNALPGKFAEPGRRWVAHAPLTEHGPYGQWYARGKDGKQVRYRNVAWHTQREETSGESYWSCPAIAAWITAAGRMRLWGLVALAGRDNTYYCDTDSLITNEAGHIRLVAGGHVRSGEAGYLRLVGRHPGCNIHGIRHYECGDSITCAGVPKGTIRPGETRGQYWIRTSAGAEIAMGCAPAGTEYRVALDGIDAYRHGRVMPDGSVLPLEVYDG